MEQTSHSPRAATVNVGHDAASVLNKAWVNGPSPTPGTAELRVTRCPFCERVDRHEYADTGFPDVVSFAPLNPVTPGHRLFVPTMHYEDATGEPQMTGTVFAAASAYGRFWGRSFNLITSVGAAATQTVRHLHVHYVPRSEGDGLPLPWTPQQEAQRA